jgi:DNA-binding XRE family transcriptional regulator
MAAENEAVEEAVDVETVGQILRAYRVAAGLTQAALAERALVGE